MRIQRRIWVTLICAGLTVLIGWYFLVSSNRADLERVVIEAMGRNDFAAAETALLKIRPRDSDVLQILADIAYRRGRKKDCIAWLEQLAESSKQPSAGFLQAGVRAFEFGLPGNAERLYRRAIQGSAALEPYSRLARLYLACRRGAELRRLLADADVANVPLKDDPMLVWLWVVGDRVDWHGGDSLQWLELVQKEQPEDGFAAAALIHSLLNSKQNVHARQVIDRFPSAGKFAWVVRLARATLELEENRPTEALSAIQQLPEEAEQQAETWFLRGRIWLACGDSEGALMAFAHANALDPWFVNAVYNHGRLLAQTGRMQESEAELRYAARIDDIVRRCRQLMNSSQLAADDVQSVVTLAAELGDTSWLRLVRQLASKLKHQRVGIDSGPRLSLGPPLAVPAGLVARRVVCEVPHSSSVVEREPAVPSKIRFVDTTDKLGVQFTYDHGHAPQRWLMETLGGGVAVLDYDRDGWQDLFFAQGGKLPASNQPGQSDGRLWRNIHASTFTDVTAVAQMTVPGYSHGCSVGDFNDDGFPDLLVCRYGGLTLMANQGDGTWINSTHGSGSGIEANQRWNTSAAFADLDDDGDLDLYVAGYCDAPFSDQLRACREGNQFAPCRPNAYPPGADTLLENLGTGQFQDRSRASGIVGDGGYGLGVIVADFDEDGAPEVFVGNDTTQNFIWHRTSPTTDRTMPVFEDRGLIAGVAVDGSGRAEACMGIACGDVDGDERLDLFVTNFFDETCTFYHNLGNLMFDDQTMQFGLSNAGRQLMGWESQFFDADNDGWLDLIIVNGHLHDQPQVPQFYRNRRGRFAEQSSSAGACFGVPRLGRSVATWDYNRDGRVDVVMSHQVEPATVLCNETETGQSVTLSLVGTRSVRDATGAVVRARVGHRKLVRLVSSQGGYLSACSADVVIGLGDATAIDDLEIQWPGGARERFGALAAGHRYCLREGRSRAISLPKDD